MHVFGIHRGEASASLARVLPNEGFDFSLPFAEYHDTAFRRFVSSVSMSVGETYFPGSEHKRGPFAVVSEIRTNQQRSAGLR